MTVRVAAIRELPALIDSLGGDGRRLLRRYAIDPEVLASPDALMPIETAELLIETAATELGRPDLGLLLASREVSAMLGVLAVAVQNAPTVGEALDVLSRYLFVHSPVLSVTSEPDPEGRPGIQSVRYERSGGGGPPQALDYGLGLVHRTLLLLCGGPYGLRSVHLPHPMLAPLAAYIDFFGTDVRFKQKAAVLRVPAQLASAPVHGGDDVLRTIASSYLHSHFAGSDSSVGDRVRIILAESPSAPPMRIESVARVLALHPRTLQRHLTSENTTFDAIHDEVRRNTAHRLITRTALPFAQIAAAIGMNEQASLTRAVRRWYGIAPRTLRRTPDAVRHPPHPVRPAGGSAR
jgi:AraC-like DNA-binding protein